MFDIFITIFLATLLVIFLTYLIVISYRIIFGIGRDITERKKIEQKLKDSEENVRSLVLSIPDVVWKANAGEKIIDFVKNYSGIAFRGDTNYIPIFFHGAVKEITGYTEQEFVGGKLPWFKLIHPDDLPSEEERYKLLNAPNYAIQREYRIYCKNGQIKRIFESSQNICDNVGKIIGVQGTINDITDFRRIKETLRESENIRILY